jgi:MSHA biogenesis protein MshG
VLGINDVVQGYGFLILIVLVLSVAGVVLCIRSPKGRRNWDRIKLRIPLVGQILLKITMSRFANMFENMIRSGVPIMHTLEIVSKTVGNEYVAEKIVEIGSKVEKGRGISKPLKDSGIFPPLVIHLVSTGEETGSLEEMLREVSVHYDREITYSVSRLSAWIEPILTAGLSVIVLFLALAVFMPWWNMMAAMKGGQ